MTPPRPAPVVAALLLALLASLAVHPAAAHGGGDSLRTLLFTVHDGTRDGEEVSWFQIANRSNANPTITVMPDERVVVHLHNAGNRSHNLRVAPPIQTATPVLEPGNETSVSVKVPADATGSFAYYDQVHRDQGAEGRVRVADAGGPQDEGGLLEDPLLLAGAAGLVLVAAGWWTGRD